MDLPILDLPGDLKLEIRFDDSAPLELNNNNNDASSANQKLSTVILKTPEFWEVRPPEACVRPFKRPKWLVKETTYIFDRPVEKYDYDADSEDMAFFHDNDLSMTLEHFEYVLGCLSKVKPRSFYHAVRVMQKPASRKDLEKIYQYWQATRKVRPRPFNKDFSIFRPPRPKTPRYGTRAEKQREEKDKLALFNRAMVERTKMANLHSNFQILVDRFKRAASLSTISLAQLQLRYKGEQLAHACCRVVLLISLMRSSFRPEDRL